MSPIWKCKEVAPSAMTPDLVAVCDNSPILAKLLALRGITEPAAAKAFLKLDEYQPTPGSEFPDMAKAVDRVRKAIENQEPILVYGDFDVDGITGTSVLMQALKYLKANVNYYIPDRHKEGHGFNTTALCRLVSSRQVKLLISTDTGVSNFNEVNLLNGLGVDTIITDHHELPENLPQALAILNPKLLPEESNFVGLSGVGVAYKLCESLLESYQVPQSAIDNLLDLVALGTVVDMVPLIRENRYLVWRGLQVLQHRERLGIQALLLEANVNETAPITSQTLGFMIGPRLNAVGRLSSANDAVDLMITNDAEQARQLAAKLEQLNRQRRELVDQCFVQAESHLINSGELSGQKAIILCSKDWNAGIVGLVATRLIDKHHRPCFIGYIDEETQEIRFSARSIEGFNMHENMLALEDLFIRWGGHSGAAGCIIAQKDLQRFKNRLFQICAERITDEQLIPVTSIDMQLTPSQVNPYLVEILDKMAPFGQENPLPVFGLEHMTIGAQRMMGENKQHLKLILTSKQTKDHLEALQWNWGEDRPKLDPSVSYRIAFTAELNTFNGATKVQLLMKDLQKEGQSSSLSPQVVESPMIPKAATTSPIANTEGKAVSASDELHWIDHRGRDEVESFLSQILMPLGPDDAGQGYRIFCEGTQQFLPIPLSETFFCGRNGGTPEQRCKNMVLWDLPPDMQSLIQLLQTQQPKVMHLMGGKYEKIPLYRAPREVLDGFLKVLQRLWKQHQFAPMALEISRLSAMLSTTQQVIITGLSLLDRLGYIQVSALAETNSVKVNLLPETGAIEQNVTERIEYIAFHNALQEVYQFREWLMTAPLNVLKSVVALEMSAGARVLREEKQRHVIHAH